jgi:hypothetical protein
MGLKTKIAEFYVWWKTYLSFRSLAKNPLNFPISDKNVKNVLIFLPLQDEYMDAALTLIRHLRQYFKKWHFMALDVRKISADKLDRLNLPDTDFLQDLAANEFQLAIDLNFTHDIRMIYLMGKLSIPYRLHLQFSDSNAYNLFTVTSQENFAGFHHVFNYLKSSFQV